MRFLVRIPSEGIDLGLESDILSKHQPDGFLSLQDPLVKAALLATSVLTER
jgi:hypothetical protein